MSSSLQPGLSPDPNPNRESSASLEREEVKKRSRKRRNSLNRYGSTKKRRIAGRIEGPIIGSNVTLNSSPLEQASLCNEALHSCTKSTFKGFEEHSNNNNKGNQRKCKDIEAHVSNLNNRIAPSSQAAQLDNGEVVCSPASWLPRTSTLELLPQSPCEPVRNTPEGRILRPRRLSIKESKENLPPGTDFSQIVGRRIEVYWPLDAAWYCGLISAYDEICKKHKVSYDDGEEEWLCLSREKFKFDTPSRTELVQADERIKTGNSFSDNSMGLIGGAQNKGLRNGLSMHMISRRRRPRIRSLEVNAPQADVRSGTISCTQAISGGELIGLKPQRQTRFFLRRHKSDPVGRGKCRTDVDGDDKIKPGCVYVRRLKCGGRGRFSISDRHISEDNQQIKSSKGRLLHGRSICRRNPKHLNEVPLQQEDAGRLCLEGPQEMKNVDSKLGPNVENQPKSPTPRKRDQLSLKDDASAAQPCLEGSICLGDSVNTGTRKKRRASAHFESRQPLERAKKKHKMKSLAYTTSSAEEKKLKIGAVAGPCDQECNQKSFEGSSFPIMADSCGLKRGNCATLPSLQVTEVLGGSKFAMEASRMKYNTEVSEPQTAGVSNKLVGRNFGGGRKHIGSHSRGLHKYRHVMKKNHRLQKFTSSKKLLSQSVTSFRNNERVASCDNGFPNQQITSSETCSTPSKTMGSLQTGILFSDMAVTKRASYTSKASVGTIVQLWVPHEFAKHDCIVQDLILKSGSSLSLSSPRGAFHNTIYFVRPDMVCDMFTWQLFNIMKAVGLFSRSSFEEKFSWTGSTRDLADIVLLFMTIVRSLPFTNERCHQHWQGRVLFDLQSVLLRRECWVRILTASLSRQADAVLMRHLRQMIVGLHTRNMTFRQMLNIFSCYILKPFVVAVLCERGVQLGVVVQKFLLLTCPGREGISFKRQFVEWVKLNSYAGVEADYLSYLSSLPMAEHQCTGTSLLEKQGSHWVCSAARDGCMQKLSQIPSFNFPTTKGLKFTTAVIGCKQYLPRGSHSIFPSQQICGSYGADRSTTDSSRVQEEARDLLLGGDFACFSSFLQSQDFYTNVCFNSMLQKCLHLADSERARSPCVKESAVDDKRTSLRQLALKVDSVKGEGVVEWEVESSSTLKGIHDDSPPGIENSHSCLKSRKTIMEEKFSERITLEDNNVSAVNQERFLQTCDGQVSAGAASGNPVSSSPFCSTNDVVYNASGSSSNSSFECTTKCKSTKMTQIEHRPSHLRDQQHGQGVFGNSPYLPLEQQSKKRVGPKRRPSATEQDTTDMERLVLCCTANVLVTRDNRSWREVGISVELQSRVREWVISVQIGDMRHGHKVLDSTVNSRVNRYTHAMMWKGGDDWTLEFCDRTEWVCFKRMHEECRNRNARAAFVRQIPIPFVKPLQDGMERQYADCTSSWSKGERWPGEVERALTCSTRVYDMDSEDEKWLAEVNMRASTISTETFERIIDKLERITFLRQGEMVVTDEVADMCANLASENAVRLVHAYWFNKRLIRENALIRYFESPLWRKYRKQCASWEARIDELQRLLPHETEEELQKQYPKPPLFAFCFQSRAVEASPSKRVQRQRSQKHLNSSFKYARTLSFETHGITGALNVLLEEESESQGGHDSMLVSSHEKGDFWQRKMALDGFFEQLLPNCSSHPAFLGIHKSVGDAQADAAAARQRAQMCFLRFNSALHRAVTAVMEFETIYFAELPLLNLQCDSAAASCKQLLVFRRRIECVLNQFCRLSGREDFLNFTEGNQGVVYNDGDEDLDDDEDDSDHFYRRGMQANYFVGSPPRADEFCREDEDLLLSISERAHLEAWMRTTLRQRAA